MNLAIFDFDGTITTKDSLIEFIRFVVGKKRFITGMLVLFPMLVAYKLKLIPNYKAKQYMLSYFFKGMSEDEFRQVATTYSLKQIDDILRPKAIEQIAWHKEKGDQIVIVSASIECWLKPWCNENRIDLIATQFEFKDGFVTGNLLSKNCHGIEKVNRLKQQYEIEKYNCIYVYGDSSGDRELLKIGDKQYYKPFRK